MLVFDYKFYLPIFFDGLREMKEPYVFMADKGLDDLLIASQDTNKVLKCLRLIMIPIKSK